MKIDPKPLLPFAATVDWLYAGMIQFANIDPDRDVESGLGGKLFYAGELDGAGCALVVAANIAGAASLAATADKAIQKQAVLDGMIDFLVNTLDEAVRILKNEVRNRQTVAVCVAKAPEDVEHAMMELGVLPDLLPPGVLDAPGYEMFLDRGARQVDPVSAKGDSSVLTWKVGANPALWLPKLDAIARDCLSTSRDEDTWSARRWLRLSPRYLGRMTQGVHLLRCESQIALEFLNQVREKVAQGAITVPVEIHLSSGGQSEMHLLSSSGDQVAEEEFTVEGHRKLQAGPTIH